MLGHEENSPPPPRGGGGHFTDTQFRLDGFENQDQFFSTPLPWGNEPIIIWSADKLASSCATVAFLVLIVNKNRRVITTTITIITKKKKTWGTRTLKIQMLSYTTGYLAQIIYCLFINRVENDDAMRLETKTRTVITVAICKTIPIWVRLP